MANDFFAPDESVVMPQGGRHLAGRKAEILHQASVLRLQGVVLFVVD